MLGASRAFGAVVLAAFVSVSEAAKFPKAWVAGSHGRHKEHHKMKLAGHDENQHASEHDAGAKMSTDEKFGEIQQELMATATTTTATTTPTQACNYDVYVGYPTDVYRRCGLSFGGNDTKSDMCNFSTGDGRLYVSASEIERRCNLDKTCAGYGHCTDYGGYYRPVSLVPHIGPHSTWTTYVKRCKVCAQDVVVSAQGVLAQGVLSSYMGVFVRTSIEPTSTQANRPIYKNNAGKVLYYWAQKAHWQIGDDYDNDNNVHLYALANTHCPESPASWKMYDGSAWSSDYTVLVDEACAGSVIVSGAAPVQPNYMGVYQRVNMPPMSYHSNRPMYRNGAGKALYFWPAHGRWDFGGADDYDNENNVHLHGLQNVSCPSAGSSFAVYDGTEWSFDYVVTVDDFEATTTAAPIAATASA